MKGNVQHYVVHLDDDGVNVIVGPFRTDEAAVEYGSNLPSGIGWSYAQGIERPVEKYKAMVIKLDVGDRTVERIVVSHYGYHVGDFTSVEEINDHGHPIDLADIEIVS